MNDVIKENLNAWVYVNWQFWGEEWNGESQESCYPITLLEMGRFLYEDDSQLSQDGESIWFDMCDWVHMSETKNNPKFIETTIYENELKALYKSHNKSYEDILTWKSIELSVEIPYSDTETSCFGFLMPLSDFFEMVTDQYLKPELEIEDIPF